MKHSELKVLFPALEIAYFAWSVQCARSMRCRSCALSLALRVSRHDYCPTLKPSRKKWLCTHLSVGKVARSTDLQLRICQMKWVSTFKLSVAVARRPAFEA